MKNLLFLFLILFITQTSAQSLQQKIETVYKRFETDSQLEYGTSSLTVLNAETGQVIFSRNGSTGLAPASTLKTITAATAYHLLGKDFTWETTLGYTGSVSSSGVLDGDVIITGTGDPSLGSERFEQARAETLLKRWTDALTRAGVKRIAGRVISDDRLFGSQTLPGGWIWNDIGNYYGAGPSALTWRENQFDLIFKPGKVGGAAQLVRTEPALSYLKIVNEVTTGRPGSGDNVYAFSAPYSEIIYLRGTYGIDLKKAISASVPDPAFDAAFSLGNKLKASGIVVEKGYTTGRKLAVDGEPFPVPAKVIDIYNSPALEKLVYWFNQKSINLYGEHLVKTLAWKNGKDITTQEGVAIIKDFWSKKLGIDQNAMNISDGSGLSPGNRITTLSMAKVLQSIKKEPWFDSFYESLPVYNNMKMKSGSISDVIAYTGYHTASSGTPLVFSFMINNYSGSSTAVRQKLFNVLNVLK